MKPKLWLCASAVLLTFGLLTQQMGGGPRTTAVRTAAMTGPVLATTTTAPTTTTAAPTTTTAPSLNRTTTHPVSRSYSRPAPAPVQGDFWMALGPGCESSDGRTSSNGLYFGYFQFSLTSWHEAGGTGVPMDHDYAYQRDIAIHWSQMTNPWGQWPVCWPKTWNRGLRP
jgi:hypothetical protein